MKKFLAIVTAAVMLLTAFSAIAEPVPARNEARDAEPVRIEGYLIGNGNSESAIINDWVGFYDSDPTSVDYYDPMVPTYAAAYYDGTVYGYIYGYDTEGVLHDNFYRIDRATFNVEYPEGATSGGEFVYGMAYNYADNTMYALCDEDNPYIASVDLETGELTRVITIDLGTYLGLRTFAIDAQGEFYVLTMSALSARLLKINKTTGALTMVANLGLPCYYAQSMTYCAQNNSIYWAHSDSATSSSNGLYKIDMSTYSISYCGMIGENYELTCLYTIPDYEEPAAETYYTVNFYDWDGTLISTQQVLEGEEAVAPADPEREGYTFTGWAGEYTHVNANADIYATYEVNYYTLTINYLDEDGNPVAEALVVSLAYGAEYSYASPEVEGYTPDVALVTGVMSAADEEIRVVYTADNVNVLLGDVNCDGVVDFSDVSALNAYLMNAGALTEQGKLNANLNGDNGITAADVAALNKLLLGIA